MDPLPSLLSDSGWNAITALLPFAWLDWVVARIGKHLAKDSVLIDFAKFGVLLTVMFILEIAARKNWRLRYSSRNFRVDVLYYVFYYSGVYHFFFYAWIYGSLTRLVADYAPWAHTNLVASLSPVMQLVALVFAFDFFHYWAHRLRHAIPYFWAFHSIHHSQTTLTMMTTFRFHVVDETVFRILMFIPFHFLGFSPYLVIWLWADLITTWVTGVQHSECNWSYGPVGRVFVSPRFHRMHHSTDERMQNRNFGGVFSFWDDIFSTAERKAPAPTEHGLAGNPIPETLTGQFVYPFVKIAGDLRRRVGNAGIADTHL